MSRNPYWGKYRGIVLDNEDLEFAGRLLCEVPALSGQLLNWATPCVPYAGIAQGFFALPPIGANVWVEFEGGDPDHPIWSGCFWEPGQVPVLPTQPPELVKVFTSQFCRIQLDDTPGAGGVTIAVVDPAVAVPVLVTANAAGLTVAIGETTILVSPEAGIVMTAGETTAELTPAVINANVAGAMTVEAETLNVTAEVTVEGATTVTGEATIYGATFANGDLEVTGASIMNGDLTVNGVGTVQPELNVAGELTLEGELNVAGASTVEGDLNVLGAVTVEGDVAVAGVIDGIVVPPLL